MQKYSYFIRFHYVYIKKQQKNGNARGSRSDSLFIDTKVKIFTCNVKSLEANAKGVQIILTRGKNVSKVWPKLIKVKLTPYGSWMTLSRPLLKSARLQRRAFLPSGAMNTRSSSLKVSEIAINAIVKKNLPQLTVLVPCR